MSGEEFNEKNYSFEHLTRAGLKKGLKSMREDLVRGLIERRRHTDKYGEDNQHTTYSEAFHKMHLNELPNQLKKGERSRNTPPVDIIDKKPIKMDADKVRGLFEVDTIHEFPTILSC